jgi:serine/threonine protein kinase
MTKASHIWSLVFALVLLSSHIAIEFADSGSLESWLRDKPKRSNFFNFCLQICDGMVYLAQQKIVHRDLSARNILVMVYSVILTTTVKIRTSVGV